MDTRFARLWAGPYLVAILAAASACKEQDANAATAADSAAATPATPISLPVVGEEVRKGDLILTVPTTGQVRSDAVATLRAEASGTVAQVLVVPGQRVSRLR